MFELFRGALTLARAVQSCRAAAAGIAKQRARASRKPHVYARKCAPSLLLSEDVIVAKVAAAYSALTASRRGKPGQRATSVLLSRVQHCAHNASRNRRDRRGVSQKWPPGCCRWPSRHARCCPPWQRAPCCPARCRMRPPPQAAPTIAAATALGAAAASRGADPPRLPLLTPPPARQAQQRRHTAVLVAICTRLAAPRWLEVQPPAVSAWVRASGGPRIHTPFAAPWHQLQRPPQSQPGRPPLPHGRRLLWARRGASTQGPRRLHRCHAPNAASWMFLPSGAAGIVPSSQLQVDHAHDCRRHALVQYLEYLEVFVGSCGACCTGPGRGGGQVKQIVDHRLVLCRRPMSRTTATIWRSRRGGGGTRRPLPPCTTTCGTPSLPMPFRPPTQRCVRGTGSSTSVVHRCAVLKKAWKRGSCAAVCMLDFCGGSRPRWV